jgi:dihydroorotase
MSVVPAQIGRVNEQGRPLAEGEPANLVLFDPEARWTVDPGIFPGASRNSPFKDMELPGRIVNTFYRGTSTVRGGELQW